MGISCTNGIISYTAWVTDSRTDFMGHSTKIDRHILGERMQTYVRYECSHGDVIR